MKQEQEREAFEGVTGQRALFVLHLVRELQPVLVEIARNRWLAVATAAGMVGVPSLAALLAR